MWISGKNSFEFLEKLLVGNVSSLINGNCFLSLILNNKAGILDDVILSKHENYFGLVSNAGNKNLVLEHMNFLKKKYFRKCFRKIFFLHVCKLLRVKITRFWCLFCGTKVASHFVVW